MMAATHTGAGEACAVPSELESQTDPAGRARVLSGAAQVLNAIGSLWIFGLMCMMLADLTGRFLFNHPIDGVAELAGLSIVAIVYLQLGSTVLSGRMTRADFISDWVANRWPRWGNAMTFVFQLFGAIVMAGLAWLSWVPFTSAWTGAETMGTPGVFQVATWPYRGAVCLGSTLATLCYLTLAQQAFMQMVRRGEQP